MAIAIRSPAQFSRPTMGRAASNKTVAAKRAGGPEDVAFYHCGCGFAFKALVTTSVGCPHCKTQQAW